VGRHALEVVGADAATGGVRKDVLLVSELVMVVPLNEGAYEEALRLLRKAPPFDLEDTDFARHGVYATKREIVFVFESPGPTATLRPGAEDPFLWKVARKWRKLMAGRPRKALTVFSWARTGDIEGVSYEATPGPGDSEGGDVYAP
jgi:hypothetical protein